MNDPQSEPIANDPNEIQLPPNRGLSEDWTAGIVGLCVLLVSLAICLMTKPEKLQWSTRLVKAPVTDAAAADAPVAESPAANTVTEKPKWNAALKGSIEKPGSWAQSPLDAFTLKTTDKKTKQVTERFAGPGILGAFIATALVSLLAIAFQRLSLGQFLIAFPGVFLLALLAYIMAKQEAIEASNLEYALWALLVGMVICNTIGTPKWMQPAVRGELFIKIGLVLLGAEVLFGRLLALGVPGVLVSWVVTPVVLIGTYIFGQRILKMESKSLNIVISADMSVCGVSAAIATAAACKAKKEELSLAIGLSLAFTVVMMVVMPRAIIAMDLDPRVGGAWIGGTIDSTGAVAAAGEALGKVGSDIAVTVKMIQNILIGVVAFGVAIYWTKFVDTRANSAVSDSAASNSAASNSAASNSAASNSAASNSAATPAPAVGVSEIWKRFPKFVIGFISASLICSILFAGSLYGELWVDASTAGITKPIREWMFCLAFICLGLDTNFRELLPYFRTGKPLILYLCGQALNLLLTFLMAYLMFGILFKE